MAAALLQGMAQVSYPVYTAEALVQRVSQETALGALTLGGIRRPAEEIASELEIMRTGQILGEVVDQSGLRVSLVSPVGVPSDVFDSVRVSREAAPRLYVVRVESGRVGLFAGDQEVASSADTFSVSGPGLALYLRRSAQLPPDGVSFVVSGRRESIADLDQALVTEHPPGTNLIRIEFSHRDPLLAASVTNLLALAYRDQAAARAREEAQRRREFLAGRLRTVGDSLEAAQQLLLEFQAESSTLDPRSEGRTLSTMMVAAQEHLREVRRTEEILGDLLGNLNVGDRQGFRQITILSNDLLPGVQDILDRLRGYEARRTELTSVSRRTEQAPDVMLLDSLIAETRNDLRLTVEQGLRLATQEREAADTRVAQLNAQVGSVPARSVAFGRFEQRVEAIQRMYDMLAGRLYEAQISEAVESGDVQIVDPAVVPERPSGRTGGSLHPVLALVLGVLGGVAIALFMERMDSRVRSADEIRKYAGAEILGNVPLMGSIPERHGLGTVANGAPGSEAFRMLRTNLRFTRPEGLHSIAITSAAPSDGKSLVSRNLALAMAQEGGKVLLIDCDLRRPVQHTVLGLDRRPGVSDLLIGEPVKAITRVEGGIYLLPAGTPVPNPAELLDSRAFEQVLAKARDIYDAVVVDLPPVLAVSDASVVASRVDGVVLVVRVGETDRGALGGAAAQLRRARSSILGVVVNGGETARYTGGYYYGYGGSAYMEEVSRNDARSSKRTAKA